MGNRSMALQASASLLTTHFGRTKMIRHTRLSVDVTDTYTSALYQRYQELRDALHRLERDRRGASESDLRMLKDQVQIAIDYILETSPDSGFYANN
jgi:hypothetical protein